jgi:uncharacterized protein YdhG (YjbR/CyaY superfamily)
MRRAVPTKDVDDYLAAVPPDARAALEKLRETIRAAAPEAVQVISYGVPTFRHHGGLVAFAAFKDHCSFFVMSPAVMEAHRADLRGYDTAKGTVHFSADKPLPAALVRKLVKARIAENEARGKKKPKKRR